MNKKGAKMNNGSSINIGLFKKALYDAEMTQTELSKRLGYGSKNTLSNKIHGKTNIYCDEANKICEILNITDQELKANIFLPSPSQK